MTVTSASLDTLPKPMALDNASPAAQDLPSILGEMNFLSPEAPNDTSQLWHYVVAPPEGVVRNTIPLSQEQVCVYDLRGTTAAERALRGLTVETSGFELVEGFAEEDTAVQWEEGRCHDEEWIKTVYYADVVRLLQRVFSTAHSGTDTDAAADVRVHIFDHVVRQRVPDAPAVEYGSSKGDDMAKERYGNGEATVVPKFAKPIDRIHVDQSDWAATQRVRLHLGEAAYRRLVQAHTDQGGSDSSPLSNDHDHGHGHLASQFANSTSTRVKLINVWRPMRNNIHDDTPLTVGDYRTFCPEQDFVVTQLHYPDRTGEAVHVRCRTAPLVRSGDEGDDDDDDNNTGIKDEKISTHNTRSVTGKRTVPGQQYHYLSRQTTDEAFVLQMWDSASMRPGVRTPKVPHGAFKHPDTPRDLGTDETRWSIEVRAFVVINGGDLFDGDACKESD